MPDGLTEVILDSHPCLCFAIERASRERAALPPPEKDVILDLKLEGAGSPEGPQGQGSEEAHSVASPDVGQPSVSLPIKQ